MRWRAVVVVRFDFPEPKDSARLGHELAQSLALRAAHAEVGKVDPPGRPQFAYLRITGRSARVEHAGRELGRILAGVGADVSASSADVVMWAAHRTGLRGRRTRASGGAMRGPGGNGGTAGVREPRRPRPPGFPPMQAALEEPS